eukprot:c45564_g1_i1.p1 GENE.c45564_g1_i1~~c45564_g1_i1.p1  ORF type:complete len:317 (-),score=56.64 c45564_g1_i1:52-1002(-)
MFCCGQKKAKPLDQQPSEIPDLSHLTPEYQALWHLRKGRDFACFNDDELLRFLRSKKLDVLQTARVVERHKRWVEDFKPQLVLMRFVEAPMRMGVWRVMGIDKQNRPVILIRMGLFNPPADLTVENYVLMTVWFMQQLVYLMDQSQAQSCLCVFDLHDWQARHALFSKHFAQSVEVIKLHYPLVISRMYAIRPSWIFHQTFKALKGFFDDDRLRFVQTPDVQRILLEDIDEDVLPDLYGGKAPMPGVPNIPGIQDLQPTESPPPAQFRKSMSRPFSMYFRPKTQQNEAIPPGQEGAVLQQLQNGSGGHAEPSEVCV